MLTPDYGHLVGKEVFGVSVGGEVSTAVAGKTAPGELEAPAGTLCMQECHCGE